MSTGKDKGASADTALVQDVPLESMMVAMDEHRDSDVIRSLQQRSHTTEEEVNVLLANEMNNLSVNERERVYQDIHGVSKEPAETPELIKSSLKQFWEHIDAFPARNKRKQAYDLAMTMDESYVTSRRLALMFLRGHAFDIKDAAEAYVGHYWAKRVLVGDHALVRDWCLDFLDDDDIECMRNGHIQLLPSRDRAGRAVIVVSTIHEKYKVMMNHVRAGTYLAWMTIMDVTTQRNGVILIIYTVGPFSVTDFDPTKIVASSTFMKTVPFRLAGLHMCYSSPVFRPFVMLQKRLIPSHTRVRFRDHEGSDMECRYKLMTFGIPVDAFPITSDGELLTDNHHRWIDAMKRLEAKAGAGNCIFALPQVTDDDSSDDGSKNGAKSRQDAAHQDEQTIVTVPTRFDVLFGRAHATHLGNYNFNEMIEDHKEEYDNASKSEKTVITRLIVSKVQQRKGRFLRMEQGLWAEVDDTVARKRVAQSFRSQRRMTKPPNGGSNSGSTKRLLTPPTSRPSIVSSRQPKPPAKPRTNPGDATLQELDMLDVDLDIMDGMDDLVADSLAPGASLGLAPLSVPLHNVPAKRQRN